MLGAAALFGATLGAVLFVAPTASQGAGGLFLWTNGDGFVTPLLAPANEKCFDTFGAKKAENFTDSDAVLNKDGLCYDLLTVLKPGESYEGSFGAVGFTPPGATGD